MLTLFRSLKDLLKLNPVRIDSDICRLHYNVTVVILIAFSLLVSARQYVGDPIDCISNEIPPRVMDTYCWISSTFTVPTKLNGRVGFDVIQPGIGHHVESEDAVKYHKYYQWVCFVLFFQALFFYAPRFLWKAWEGGRIQMLVADLDCPIVSDEKKCESKKKLLDYFVLNLNCQNSYVYQLLICEVLNLVNVFGQIVFMDFFLGGEFSTYGSEVVQFTEQLPQDRVDPMSRVFPKVTKCTFYKYGPTGTIQTFDSLCVLSVNIINEKIYVFLWFWFMTLFVLTAVALVYRSAMVLSPKFRDILLRYRARLTHRDQLNAISTKFQVGDWFLLYQLGANIDPWIFKEVVSELSERLEEDNAPVAVASTSA